ncbi:hypothetical protein TWF481_001482 [Arthrobotrys musiformis]|uniref:BTB domain-containing protein n=1 Tax=Arthrobotrys musiformis TaxID=47236 RepID=A0AAV9WQN5_9PEZI
MEELLESGNYSDFTIICGSKEWKVHRAIICPQSEYFKTLCESKFKEREDGELDLSAEPPFDVECMLKFLYTGTYPAINIKDQLTVAGLDGMVSALSASSISKNENGEDDNHHEEVTHQELSDTTIHTPADPAILQQRHHIAMYAVGDQYIIDNLKAHAAKNFIGGLVNKWTEDHWCLLDDIDRKTVASDHALRAPILELWLNDGIELFRLEGFRENMTRFPTMELEFLREYSINITSKIVVLQAELGTEKKGNAAKSLELKGFQSRTESLIDFTRSLGPSHNKWLVCRHCEEPFGGRLEKDHEGDGSICYLLRCRACSTKHQLPGARFKI